MQCHFLEIGTLCNDIWQIVLYVLIEEIAEKLMGCLEYNMKLLRTDFLDRATTILEIPMIMIINN